MQTPVLVVGRMDAPAILKHGEGYFDDDQVYDLFCRSDPFMPAGLGGEVAFFTIYVTTTHFDPTTTLRVTPRVDGVALDPTEIVLNTAPGSDGQRMVHEIGLSKPYLVAGVEKLRYAPRGSWMDVLIESQRAEGFGIGARQIVDGIECEFEVVQEGKEPLPMVSSLL